MFGFHRPTHLFFDLDHTLWDFDRNSEEALEDLYERFELEKKGVANRGQFLNRYKQVNAAMWDQYHRGIIDKETLRTERFRETLLSLGVAPRDIPDGMWQEYLRICPLKTNLMPGAIETLDALKDHFTLAIITNGFKEVQYFKLKHAGLSGYFSEVIISEETGFQKPHEGIFNHALERTGAKAHESLMIGDNLDTDIAGALKSEWDAIWYNPTRQHAPPWIRRQILALPELTFLL